MLNQSKIPSLMADKRVEALLKKEMVEHQAIISSHHKEMQTLRDSLTVAMQRFDSLFNRSEQELKDLSKDAATHIDLIKKKLISNELTISEQRQTIISLSQQLQDFDLTHVKKSDLESLKKESREQIKQSTESHLNSFQDLQREIRFLFQSLKDDFEKLKVDLEKKFFGINEISETKFSQLKMDKEGLSEKFRIYDKTIFIIEKKIENIYTLIERINKRGEVCHKQD